MNNPDILVGTSLTKTYGELAVVKNVSLAIREGEFVSLVGKSGCGKTTLLSILSGLERPSSGQAVLNGKNITSASEDDLALFRRENVGFVFQSFNLIPTLSAWENVALPLFPVKMTEAERRQRPRRFSIRWNWHTGWNICLPPFRAERSSASPLPVP